MTITRSFESCPASYTATTQTTTAFAFDPVGGVVTVSLNATSGLLQSIMTEVNTKFDSTGGIITGLVQGAKSTNIASAGTTNLATLTGNFAHVTGTTTINSFGTVTAGTEITLVFDGVLILTHNATSLILPTGNNITTTV